MKKIWTFVFLLMATNSEASTPNEYGIPDEIVFHAMKLARDNLHLAVDSNGNHFAVETDAEKKEPLIPFDDARRTVNIGRTNGLAEWCGLDHEPLYLVNMQFERAKKIWNDKQIAYISIIHGVTQSYIKKSNQDRKGECPDELRHKLKVALPKQIESARKAIDKMALDGEK